MSSASLSSDTLGAILSRLPLAPGSSGCLIIADGHTPSDVYANAGSWFCGQPLFFVAGKAGRAVPGATVVAESLSALDRAHGSRVKAPLIIFIARSAEGSSTIIEKTLRDRLLPSGIAAVAVTGSASSSSSLFVDRLYPKTPTVTLFTAKRAL